MGWRGSSARFAGQPRPNLRTYGVTHQSSTFHVSDTALGL